jgi:hypothetical protein
MALLVGMDEAGYGPHLGPLVVAGAAVEFPAGHGGASRSRADAAPDACLWELLRREVRRRVAGASDRVVICDSKRAYSSADREAGLAVLERAVLGFLGTSGLRPRTLADLLDAIAVRPANGSTDGDGGLRHGAAGLCPGGAGPAEPWHRPHELALPFAAEAGSVAEAARLLGRGLAAAGADAGRLWVNVAAASRLNRLIEQGGRNKAAALFALTVEVLREVRRSRPEADLFVTMDQHGGRRYYAGLLAGAFPMQAVETVEESSQGSRYRVGPPPGFAGGRWHGLPARESWAGCPCHLVGFAGAKPGGRGTMHLLVTERAEERSLLVALASMAAKYVRELHMHQMNAFFRARVPGLRATAGYGRDARRFLDETASARAAAGLPLEVLLRAR